MKKFFKYITVFAGCATMLISCKKDELRIVDVPFSADKITVSVGDTVNFKIGSGADALAIYTGDVSNNFANSRINLVENKGYTEQELKGNLYAERIPGLKEYRLYVPAVDGVPQGYTVSSGNIESYTGKLVPWDYSDATKSKYLKLNLAGGPQTLTINMNKAVIPGMLNYAAAQLSSLGAITTAPNNNFTPYMAFPDGFGPNDVNALSVRFAFQIVIDGLPGDVIYFDQTVREFLEGKNYNLAATNGVIANWKAKNPTGNIANGIDEIRFTFNADDPARADDDGDLLDYKGNVYIQEIALGDPANMVKSFDKGVAVPFVFKGTTVNYSYAYSTPGTYTATLVCTYYGRKQYSGDGYQTGRADEISASEYPHERRYKTITITVQ